jgi:hypothetical protein
MLYNNDRMSSVIQSGCITALIALRYMAHEITNDSQVTQLPVLETHNERARLNWADGEALMLHVSCSTWLKYTSWVPFSACTPTFTEGAGSDEADTRVSLTKYEGI